MPSPPPEPAHYRAARSGSEDDEHQRQGRVERGRPGQVAAILSWPGEGRIGRVSRKAKRDAESGRGRRTGDPTATDQGRDLPRRPEEQANATGNGQRGKYGRGEQLLDWARRDATSGGSRFTPGTSTPPAAVTA
jgi:hypothetical protein